MSERIGGNIDWTERISRIQRLGSEATNARLSAILAELDEIAANLEAPPNENETASIEAVINSVQEASLHFFQSGGVFELLATRSEEGLKAWGEDRVNKSHHKFAGYVARLEDNVPRRFLEAYPELASRTNAAEYNREPLSESKINKPSRAKAAIFKEDGSTYIVIAGFLGYDQKGRSNQGSLVLELDDEGADNLTKLLRNNRGNDYDNDNPVMSGLILGIFGTKLPTNYPDTWGPFTKRPVKIEEIKDLRK